MTEVRAQLWVVPSVFHSYPIPWIVFSTVLKIPRSNLNTSFKASGNYSNIKLNLKAPLHKSFVQWECEIGYIKISTVSLHYTTTDEKLYLPAPSDFRYLQQQASGSDPHFCHTKPLVSTYPIQLPPLWRLHDLSEIWPTKAMLWHCRWRNYLFPASSAQSSVNSLPFGKDLHTALVNIAT